MAGRRTDALGDRAGALSGSVLVLAGAGFPSTASSCAAALNRLDLLEALLAQGIDVNTRHWQGLHAAALMGHLEAVRFLLSPGSAAEKASRLQFDEAADIVVSR